MIKAVFASLALMCSACSFQDRVPSIGGPPVQQISYPVSVTLSMCLQRAKRKYCNGYRARLLDPAKEEREKSETVGRTASIARGRTQQQTTFVSEG